MPHADWIAGEVARSAAFLLGGQRIRCTANKEHALGDHPLHHQRKDASKVRGPHLGLRQVEAYCAGQDGCETHAESGWRPELLITPIVVGALQVTQTGKAQAETVAADMGAAILGAHLGKAPGHISNHGAYIQNWMKLLADDKRAFVFAAAQAQLAVDWLLDKSSAPEAAHVAA
jgi:hypothetical protein